MPYAVSALSPSSVEPQTRKTRLRFRGHLDQAPNLTSGQLQAYQDVILQSFPDLTKKYGTFDMKGGYNRLFVEMKRKVNDTAQIVSPQDITHYKNRNLFGVVEEATDCWFELWETRAVIQNKWIKQQQVEHWSDVLKEYRQAGRPFADYFNQIQSELPAATVEDFEKMTGLSSQQAKQMLALIGGKMGMFHTDHPNFDMVKDTQPLLMDEIQELFENQPGFSLEKAAISAMGWLYSNVPHLPVGVFDKVLMRYVQKQTQLPFEQDQVAVMPRYKIANRMYMQYTHFYWYGSDVETWRKDFKKTYQERKAMYKGAEIMVEAGILKKAELDAQKSKMSLVG